MKIKPLTIFIALILILLTLIIPYKICQIVIYFFLFIFFISFIYLKIIVKNIKVERNKLDLKISCNEKTEISFNIKNYSKLTVFLCFYQDLAPYFYIHNSKNEGLITLHPRENKRISYFITAHDRGRYVIGPVKIVVTDPFNLFTYDLFFETQMNIIVRPERLKLITLTNPGYPQGNIKIQNICYEDTTLRRNIREYKNGDEIKRINWKASAKYSTLFTNQYENSYDSPFFIFLDLAEDDYNIKNRNYFIEKAIQLACSIIEKSRILNQRCGFAAYGTGFPFLKPAKNQTEAILDILSVIQKEKGKLDYNPYKKFESQLPQGTLIFVINENVVQNYFTKVEAEKENINTQNIGISKKSYVK